MPLNELKPCPFCGGEVTMAYTGSSDWDVTCRGSCPVTTHFWVSAKKHGYGEGEHAEAIRRWNTRALPEEAAIKEVCAILRAVEDQVRRVDLMYTNLDTRITEFLNKHEPQSSSPK